MCIYIYVYGFDLCFLICGDINEYPDNYLSNYPSFVKPLKSIMQPAYIPSIPVISTSIFYFEYRPHRADVYLKTEIELGEFARRKKFEVQYSRSVIIYSFDFLCI